MLWDKGVKTETVFDKDELVKLCMTHGIKGGQHPETKKLPGTGTDTTAESENKAA